MDVGAFVQENKRWLLSCAIGGLAWLIGSSVVSSLYDYRSARMQLRKSATSTGELFDKKARDSATGEAEAISAELKRLRDELEFAVDAEYRIDGKGMPPDDYLTQVGSQLKQDLLQRADQLAVQVQDKDLTWRPATDAEAIRSELFGLNLIAEAADRLLSAHEAVRKANGDTPGLRTMAFTYDDKKSARGSRSSAKSGEVDLRQLFDEEQVTFSFQSDCATAYRFLESCRKPGKALVVETIVMTPPGRPGELITVKGTLRGIAWKQEGK